MDFLLNFFKLEVVSEQEDGYVVVASAEVDMATFLQKVQQFGEGRYGSGTTAKIYDVIGPENQQARIDRLLSDSLKTKWTSIDDADVYSADFSIECLGSTFLPPAPEKGVAETEGAFAARMVIWREKQRAANLAWDDLMEQRESQFRNIIAAYRGEILDIVHGEHLGVNALPDSFTVRVRISGAGLKDLALNFPFVFEVSEPEDLDGDLRNIAVDEDSGHVFTLLPPDVDAPALCVIDSGIQEQHPMLAAAIDVAASRCFIPDFDADDVADYVPSGGHGTRVAGAAVYPKGLPTDESAQASFWIQNARVLDANNGLSANLAPPLYLKAIVDMYRNGPKQTKLFNHSIAAYRPCRRSQMSAWAAAIDMLSWESDVLFFQSAGNLPEVSAAVPFRLGIVDHIQGGHDYPHYLTRDSSRIPSPSESLQALTVGSISYAKFYSGTLSSFGELDQASSFTTTGLGIWGCVKPEVVEYGGDFVRDSSGGGGLTTPPEVCTELLRSTMHGGPLSSRDDVGTSFAAPKVAAIGIALQKILPNEPALLYRSLIVNSARWPNWAEHEPDRLSTLRQIGFGVPDIERATSNTPFRVTLITGGEQAVKAKEAQIYQIPIPESLRGPGDSFDVRIDVTLSYVARPRRTRRTIRQYLSTWADWKSSKFGELLESFQNRVLKDGDMAITSNEGVIPWTIREKNDWGTIGGVRRGTGTVQKDWVIMKSHQLPADFCIGVIGHPGWDKDPDAVAKYALSVTFEVVNQELEIYDEISASVAALVEVGEIEAQVAVNPS